ncbi:RNA/RNP complex-1-interacting phosphatase [Anopheles ziemanni]|uniref:RNA/RNP complex-1-interacting phosphatase n=1 Tax=Anopheles coustani TaxID=139045 RepID=UPI0026591733|nr:RNA/RNP complex-1-interacting phosphatase [Anopheles coustani]XP_058172566.1 RNA/RNP complex-1-interacting phosphatase [Anopheles ziemanni]
MKGVPDRWFDYTLYGNPVAGRFVALKVPLDRKFQIRNDERFLPKDAIEKLPLGLVIDLTNTKRYYNPQEFISRGIKYEKFAVQGHCGAPKIEAVRRFIQIVNQFMEDRDSRDKLIGVHCTHGLNRTGYMVCAYMILQMGFRAKDAIELFNEKRGHTMERENYLESLRSLDTVADKGCTQKEWEEQNTPVQHSGESTHGQDRFASNRSWDDTRQHRNHEKTWNKDERGTDGHERFSRKRHHEDSWNNGERGTRYQHERKDWRQQSSAAQFSGESNYRQDGFPRDRSRSRDTRQHGYREEPWNKDKRPTQYQRDRDTRYQAKNNTQQQGGWRERYSWRRRNDSPGDQHSRGIDDRGESTAKRINRFPPGRYGGVPKRTVFE